MGVAFSMFTMISIATVADQARENIVKLSSGKPERIVFMLVWIAFSIVLMWPKDLYSFLEGIFENDSN